MFGSVFLDRGIADALSILLDPADFSSRRSVRYFNLAGTDSVRPTEKEGSFGRLVPNGIVNHLG